MSKPRLTVLEMRLLDILWERGEATVEEVRGALDQDLAYTTVMTMLYRLTKNKPVLKRWKRGQLYVYCPLVTREDVCRSVLKDVREVLFHGHLPALVLNLLSDAKMSDGDITAIREALDQIEGHS